MCPNPILAGVDLAAHTERIRIGQAASIITFHHPVQLAEDHVRVFDGGAHPEGDQRSELALVVCLPYSLYTVYMYTCTAI